MNELQQAICDKFSLYLPSSALEADYLLTPNGVLYTVDEDNDIKLADESWLRTGNFDPHFLDFLFNLDCVFVARSGNAIPIGVRIDPTK